MVVYTAYIISIRIVLNPDVEHDLNFSVLIVDMDGFPSSVIARQTE